MAMIENRPKTHKTGTMRFKFALLFLAATVALVYMANQILYWQMNHGEDFERRAINQLINRSASHESPIVPNRGSITDRNGQVLAFSTLVYTVFVDVRMLARRSEERQALTIENTSRILNIPEENLWALLARDEEGRLIHDTHYRIIATQQPHEVHLALYAARLFDVYTEESTRRTYVYGTVAAPVIGFVRGGTAWGIESRFNEELSGVNGRVFRSFDTTGRNVVTERIDSVDGATIVTTLDLPIQLEAEYIVKKYGQLHNARFTSAIVMNPNTGEIIAMATYPTFNLNDPMNPIYLTNPQLAYEWGQLDPRSAELVDNFNRIWRNFNISHTFEPGSIYKPITVAMALEEGIIDFDDRFQCNGSIVVSGITISCHQGVRHGNINVREAVAFSCNVAMVQIAERMGRDIFYNYHRDFGYGLLTGIDLPGEASAAVLQHTLAGLNPIELATASFGQRFNATPLQALTSFNALINGGFLHRPFVVSQVVGPRNNVIYERTPEVVRTIISREVSDFMRDAMVDTFIFGTGRRARIYGHDVGGKSGTGEQGTQDNPDYFVTAAFVGYFPPHDPQYTVFTVIYAPDGPTPSASFMFMELVLAIIQHRNIAPSGLTVGSGGGVTLFDYTEMSLETAIQVLNSAGLDFYLVGNGDIITGQFPPPGEIVSQNANVFLILDRSENGQLAEVPDTMGLTVRQAREILIAAGFTPIVSFDDPSNRIDDLNVVFSQMPEPFQRVSPGIEVRVSGRMN